MPEAESGPVVLLFDVNETLLDTAPLQQKVGDILLDPHGAKLWFTTMLHYSVVMTASERYAAFPEIGAATLQMLARNSDIALSLEDAKAALSVMRSLPAHPDVRPALERLRAKGFRLATLTNSSQSGVQAQLEHAQVAGLFERQLSVESVGRFKPHRSVYAWAAAEMGVEAKQCMLWWRRTAGTSPAPNGRGCRRPSSLAKGSRSSRSRRRPTWMCRISRRWLCTCATEGAHRNGTSL